MLIKFHILWIEDNDEYFNQTEQVLRTHLESLGFHLEVQRISNPVEEPVEGFLGNTSKYDLILVDLRFANNPGEADEPIGGSIIEQIRKKLTYADIMFYSGDPDLEKRFQEKALQGVYLSKRGELKEDAKDLITQLLHKTQHPKIMRGILVSELSHIDSLCFDVINLKYSVSTEKPSFTQNLRDSLTRQIDKQYKDKLAKIGKEDAAFIESLKSTMLMDSSKRVLQVTEFSSSDSLDDEVKTNIAKLPDTVSKRNRLAHWKRTEETDLHIRLEADGESPYIFDQNEATRMRKCINTAAKALTTYIEYLTAQAK